MRNVLILCTGNSARSILAEAILNQRGQGRFRAYSAGSFPRGEVHPLALETLERMNLPTAGLRSKSWNEFAGPDAPIMDFIFTVCDQAAGEMCPIWPGHPLTAHWGLPDPAAATGSHADRLARFAEAFGIIEHRIKAFLSLDFATADDALLRAKLLEVGSLLPAKTP